jgi:hypothetical protein
MCLCSVRRARCGEGSLGGVIVGELAARELVSGVGASNAEVRRARGRDNDPIRRRAESRGQRLNLCTRRSRRDERQSITRGQLRIGRRDRHVVGRRGHTDSSTHGLHRISTNGISGKSPALGKGQEGLCDPCVRVRSAGCTQATHRVSREDLRVLQVQ